MVARETLVSGHGRPAASGQRHSLVEQLADDRAGARIDHAKRGVYEVAVLRVLEAEQRAVRGERPAEESVRFDAPEPHRAIGAVDRPCGAAVDRDVDGEALAVGDRRDDDPRRLGEPFVPSVRHAVEEERRLASVERLHVPAAGLVAALVLEPENALAVERRDGVDETHRMVGHLPALAGLGVERVDLPDAGLVRDVDGATRSARATTPGDTRRALESAVPMRADSSSARLPPKIASVLIAGNWKMFKGAHQAREFAAQIRRIPEHAAGVDVVVCPPFASLEATLQGLGSDSGVRVYAQNVHWELEGAFTGEVSAPMLLELGVTGALVGHSERRQHFGETDETVRLRAEAALEAGLHVIACVGETEAEREAGETEAVLARQVGVIPEHERLVVAYEPVWAIGTGKTATPEIAQAAHAFVKSLHASSVLYGGSVKPDNAEVLLGLPDVDGALVGGASLDFPSFEAVCRAGADAWA